MDSKTPRSIFDFWREDVKIYPQGITRRRRSRLRNSCAGSPSVRGTIKSFSSHSSLRMRRALLDNTLDSKCYVNLGVTLTLPWAVSPSSDLDKVTSDYKIAFNRFSVAFRRRFPNSAAIFRHELQKRRAPHCHVVLWLSDIDFHFVKRGRAATSSGFRSIVFSLWFRAVSGFDYQYSRLDHFSRRGVLVDLLSDNIAMYRYISDHASKKKQSQLGYNGKQWGFINRSLFVVSPSVVVKFTRSSDYVCFNRHVSKCSRFFVIRKGVKKLSSRSMNRSVVFINNRTALNLYAAIKRGFVCSQGDLLHCLYRQEFERLKKFRPSNLLLSNL